ncbi:MAG: pantoate--beta-alanine ligase [Candidatus Bipolaricaulota bacterium]|nr:MAG: pantoate--beta-alanine ligase [Candidatus Bipolaricaulota bacterium]
MNVATTIADVRALRSRLEEPVGLAPTMGYLHEGHLSLVRLARAECASVVASVFVNPTQFAPGEDFTDYPRDLERDLALLEAEGVDLVFAPGADELYAADHTTWIELPTLTGRLEGASRPTHFRGVATIVLKLVNIVAPQVLVLGQKDAQQAVVVGRMLRELDVPVELRIGPTVREEDGLAMSSRNAYLAPDDRTVAAVLYRALRRVEALWRDGERDADALREAISAVLAGEPSADVDYVSVADPESLEELDGTVEAALASIAVRIGRTRLIDNLVLGRSA